MITLDATLAAAQDSASRRPLVEIVSAQRMADIPFDGSMLTSETFNEYGVNMIAHSSGRLVLAYIYYSGTTSGIKFVCTDPSRTEFTTFDLALYTYGANEIKAVSICEMTGGNIGMVLLVDDKSNHLYRLTRRIYTVAGVAVSNAEIANWSHDTYTSDPWVQTLGANSYLMVYGKKVNATNYGIYKRTSSDFLTWSAESALSIGGLTATWRLSNPSIIKITTGDLWLWFDVLESTGPSGEELTNIYYSVSADGGGTWGAAVKVTNYAFYSEIGKHPVAIQKAANQMHLLFTRQVGALHMGEAATGWPTGDSSTELSWDAANRKLYAINQRAAAGARNLQNVVRIDADTWACEKYWDSTTTPGFPSWITDGSHSVLLCSTIHEGHHIAVFCTDNSGHRVVWHLDGPADTITQYNFDTNAEHSLVQNITHSIPSGHRIAHQQMDATNNKIWVLFATSYVYTHSIILGYIDLAETSDYQFHELFTYSGLTDTEVIGTQAPSGRGGMFISNEDGVVVLTGSTGGTWTGFCAVFDLATGGLIVKWNAGDADFPRFGLMHPLVYNGKIYAAMGAYTSGYGQSSYRGLAEIDWSSETITLHRPTYCTEDNHYFCLPAVVGNNRIAMTHEGYGVAIFDTLAKTWEIFNNSNIPGFTPDTYLPTSDTQIAYDSVNELIMVGDTNVSYGRATKGVIMFSSSGFLRQAYYRVGTDPGGGWSFAEAAQLVQGVRDYDAVGAVDPAVSTSMFVFWINETPGAEKSVKWDKDGSSLDLSKYLTNTEIVVTRTIDGNPATLEFEVSHGHLFDPYNQASLFLLYLQKGRKLTIRFGEKISGTDYWQNAGAFFVTGTSLSFARGDYPVMKVKAEDQRCLWAQAHIFATAIYDNMPEDIITDLVDDFAGIGSGECNLPVFENRQALAHQWLDTTLDEVLNQICERFGYYYRFDVEGLLSVRRITNAGAIDHVYTDLTKLLRYSPDDRYSDFTNKIVVIGQERDFTDVTFEEERITTLAGTLGWWGCRAEHKVAFSDDMSRRCVNPRLHVTETAVSIPFQLAGSVSEYLEECDPADDNRFCTVYASAPNLIPMLAVFLGVILARAFSTPDMAPQAPSGTLPTIPWGRLIEKVGLIGALMILGSVANYQYEIWAQPLGSERRSVQGIWEDLVHQALIGTEPITRKIEDPLCYSSPDCTAVASFEGMVVQMQRRRVVIEKIAHLQDEEGDTIRFVHPYSGQNIDLFVTDLKRTYIKGGGFTDEISGWMVGL